MRFKTSCASALLALQALCGNPAWGAGTTITRDNTIGTGPTTPLAASGTFTTTGVSAGPILLSGPATYNKVTIPESYGQRSGANVFHSFSTFNVGSGDAAVFTIAAPATNIISRVTGGSVSTIAGLLAVDPGATGSTPNLFLINPAGVLFTGTSAIQVPGTFHVSTAGYLKFPDGLFYSDPVRGSTFSAADPSAFGFLGASRATIGLQGNPIVVNSLSVAAGDVSVSPDVGFPNIRATGNIRVAAVGQDVVEVPLSGAMPALHGTISVAGILNSYASSALNEVTFAAGDITFTGGTVQSGAAPITVTAANNFTLNGGTSSLGAFSGIQTGFTGTGNGGNINVTVGGTLSLLHGGGLSAETVAAGNAGNVTVRAGNIVLDGTGYDLTGIYSQSNGLGFVTPGVGAPGSINVTATGSISLYGEAQISNSTNSIGSAGTVTVTAPDITLNGAKNTDLRDYSGITSNARVGSSGGANSGNILVTATDTLTLLNGARVSSTTYSTGAAGNVTVNAGNVTVDGTLQGTPGNILAARGDGVIASSIQAAAQTGSSGQTGNVSINASGQVVFSNGGLASIQNGATVATPGALLPTTLTVSAPDVTLQNSSITAASTGNVAASNIRVNVTDMLRIDPSTISTTSNLGNGGAITIDAGNGAILLDNSQITTSVLGLSGNGGNISIQGNALVMNTGFIQANTAAAAASGGTVTIGVNSLLTSGNSLFLGGNTPYTAQPFVFGFNVIQAASPSGLSGDIHLTSPALDVARSLTGLNAKTVDAGGLGRSPCRITGGSSLAQAGRGGFAPSATDLLGTSGTGVATAGNEGRRPTLVALAARDSWTGGCK